MPLVTREVLMIISASDRASRILNTMSTNFGASARQAELAAAKLAGASEAELVAMKKVQDANVAAGKQLMKTGAAMTAAGVGITYIGYQGAQALYNWTQQAIEYNRTAALTLTQDDNIGASLQKVAGIGEDVASKIGVPFEQLQSSLYDIYSSMDVTDAQARDLLEAFAKSAVAGQVSIQEADKATIGIMNAWQMKASDVNHVNDVMFELVKKGVGTYGDFASVMGLSVPSAVRAGQSVETLAGMLAFMTRNGLSASRASTSAARALDSFSNPVFRQHMTDLGSIMQDTLGKKTMDQLGLNAKDLGISLVDSSGNYRALGDVVTELGDKLSKLTDPQKSEVLKKLFGGAGGTIQSLRFWNLAINNAGQLNSLLGDMGQSAGAAQTAYNTMSQQLATKTQLLKNNFQVLRIVVGEALIPIFTKLVGWLTKAVQWFNNLSPRTKEFIAYGLAAVTAITLLVGAITTLAGIFLILRGTSMAAGTSLGSIATKLGVWGLVIAAVAVAAYFIIKYHKQIWDFIQKIWDIIVRFLYRVWSDISGFAVRIWNDIYKGVVDGFNATKDFVLRIWNDIWTWLQGNWKYIAAGAITILMGPIVGAVFLFHRQIWDFIQRIWHDIVGFLSKVFDGPIGYIKARFNEFMDFWNSHWDEIHSIAQHIWSLIVTQAKLFWTITVGLFRTSMALIKAIWEPAWRIMSDTFKAIWDQLTAYVQFAWSILSAVIDTGLTLIKDLWVTGWDVIWQALKFAWDTIVSIVTAAWQVLWDFIQVGLNAFITFWQVTWDIVSGIFKTVWGIIADTFELLWHAFLDSLGIFLDLLTGHWSRAWNDAKKLVSDIWNGIVKLFSDFAANALGFLLKAGKDLIQGFMNGIRDMWQLLRDTWNGAIQVLTDFISNAINFLMQAGQDIITGFVVGINAVASFIKSAWDAAMKFFVDFAKNALTFLFNVGKDIIQGLINGMKSMYDKIKNTVTDIGTGIKEGFLNFFHMGSPSKLFHQYGQWLMQGLANGITSGSGAAVDALTKANNALNWQNIHAIGQPIIGSQIVQTRNPVGVVSGTPVVPTSTYHIDQLIIQSSAASTVDAAKELADQFIEAISRKSA